MRTGPLHVAATCGDIPSVTMGAGAGGWPEVSNNADLNGACVRACSFCGLDV